MKSTKIPIKYPAASTAIIGATVTMLTSIIDGCSSISFEAKSGLKILSLIPLSRNCANLWRKLYYIKGLIHCHFERILTKTLWLWRYRIKGNTSVNKPRKRHRDCKICEGIVIFWKENPQLRLIIRQRVWIENSRIWIMTLSVQFTVWPIKCCSNVIKC